MTLTLYGGPRTRASIIRWYLEEKGIPYVLQSLDLQQGEHRQEPFLRINPFGKVPALVDDSLHGPDGSPLRLFESGAILMHLAEHQGREFDGPAEGAAVRRPSPPSGCCSPMPPWLLPFFWPSPGRRSCAGSSRPSTVSW